MYGGKSSPAIERRGPAGVYINFIKRTFWKTLKISSNYKVIF